MAGLAEVDRDLAEASAEIQTTAPADLPALFERISALSARREALALVPSEPVVETVATGETFAQRWSRLSDPADRRALLMSAPVEIELLPTRRRGSWDPGPMRLTLPQDYVAGSV